jgi:hypothetical protein
MKFRGKAEPFYRGRVKFTQIYLQSLEQQLNHRRIFNRKVESNQRFAVEEVEEV